MEKITVEDLYDLLIDLGMFTEEELLLLTKINGFNFQTLEDALYCRFGYGSIDQFLEELQEEEEEEELEDEEEEEE